MIGRRIESKRGLPWACLGCASVGLAMLGYGLASGLAPFTVGSALPLGIAVAMLIAWAERPFAATLGEDAIEVEGQPGLIAYSTLRHVRVAGYPHEPSTFRKSRASILVDHDGGVLRIPPGLNAPSHELYRFLAARVPPNGDRAVNPALAEYFERQASYFGLDRVWTYRAAARRPSRGRYRRVRAVCFGLILGGVAWMVAGFSGLVDQAWAGAGIMASLIGGCFWLVTLAEGVSVHGIKNWTNASLVIGPQGMAMVQGDIQGEVRWPELLDVRFRPRPAAFRLTQHQNLQGIVLKLNGADVLIADIYDRPLYLIHDRILAASGRRPAADPVDP